MGMQITLNSASLSRQDILTGSSSNRRAKDGSMERYSRTAA
jgi:hypothetical protein